MSEPEKEIERYKSGAKQHVSYKIDGEYHRKNSPASISYYSNGNKVNEKYFNNGQLHREDGPAIIEWGQHERLRFEKYFINDKRHREDGPAVIAYIYITGDIVKDEEYWIKGERITEQEFYHWKIKNGLEKRL